MHRKDENHRKIIGYITHEVVDKFGRLLLAEGTPLTEELVRRLDDRKVCFRISKAPIGSKTVGAASLNFHNRNSPFTIMEKLDDKFDKLDTESVWNATEYLKSILFSVEKDFFMSNLIKVLSQRQRATYSHSINVAILAIAIAEKMKMNKKSLQNIAIGAILHDVGEVFLPSSVTKGTSRIGDSNEILFQQHTRIGADVLLADKLPASIYLIALQHHERYTGGGYPSGLRESEIHINASIISVADVFDRLTTSIYQGNVLSPNEAVERILLDKGISFHPDIVEIFAKLFKTDEKA